MTRLRILIVDDEALACRELRRMLEAHPRFVVEGQAHRASDARRLCREARVAGRPFDLVFLDIELPDGTGFDALEAVGDAAVVFVTAYDQHAVRAFRARALDYLMKPVLEDELADALRRVEQRIAMRPSDAADPSLLVRDGTRRLAIRLAEIRLIEAAGDYCRISYGGGRSVLEASSLAAISRRIPTTHFFRANRQQIIGVAHIVDTESVAGGRLRLRLNDGQTVDASTRCSRHLRAQRIAPST